MKLRHFSAIHFRPQLFSVVGGSASVADGISVDRTGLTSRDLGITAAFFLPKAEQRAAISGRAIGAHYAKCRVVARAVISGSSVNQSGHANLRATARAVASGSSVNHGSHTALHFAARARVQGFASGGTRTSVTVTRLTAAMADRRRIEQQNHLLTLVFLSRKFRSNKP